LPKHEVTVDFFQELWFIVVNVPNLAHRYQGESIWATASLVISIASTLIKNRLAESDAMRRDVLKWLSRASMGVTVLVFVLAFVDLARTRIPFDDIVCTEIAADAYYHAPGEKTYELVERYACSNRTNTSIRNFASLQDGYFERIPVWDVQYKLLGSPSVELVVRKRTEPELRRNNYPGGPEIVYYYGATAEFVPPLSAGAGIDLVYKLSAIGTEVEKAAFTKSGTVFARGVPYGTLRYSVTIHAPPGYEVKLRDWAVMDPSGRLIPEETQRQTGPRSTHSDGSLHWSVSLARRHVRYMLRYSLESYGFEKS
jgi:hypothetical protein